MLTIHVTDTTDTRRPVITLSAETVRVTRNTLVLGNVGAVYGATVQETSDGAALAHERADEWRGDLEADRYGESRTIRLSLPEWAADLA